MTTTTHIRPFSAATQRKAGIKRRPAPTIGINQLREGLSRYLCEHDPAYAAASEAAKRRHASHQPC